MSIFDAEEEGKVDWLSSKKDAAEYEKSGGRHEYIGVLRGYGVDAKSKKWNI